MTSGNTRKASEGRHFGTAAAFTKRHLHSGGLGEAEAAMLEVAGDQYLIFSICLLYRRVLCRVISVINYNNYFKPNPASISLSHRRANRQQSPLNLPTFHQSYHNTATMSSESFAMTRKTMGPELAKLAEEHMKHDLQQSDRDALHKAASTVSTWATAGSLLGLSLGTLLAFRIRRSRTALFKAFKTREQPTALRFASGKEEPLPDLTNAMKPSTLGDVATYCLLGGGGIFFGGETGLLAGSFRARQQIGSDRDGRDRIQRAFRRFQADALRQQAQLLENEDKGSILGL
jgi:hypothetical protein